MCCKFANKIKNRQCGLQENAEAQCNVIREGGLAEWAVENGQMYKMNKIYRKAIAFAAFLLLLSIKIEKNENSYCLF